MSMPLYLYSISTSERHYDPESCLYAGIFIWNTVWKVAFSGNGKITSAYRAVDIYDTCGIFIMTTKLAIISHVFNEAGCNSLQIAPGRSMPQRGGESHCIVISLSPTAGKPLRIPLTRQSCLGLLHPIVRRDR